MRESLTNGMTNLGGNSLKSPLCSLEDHHQLVYVLFEEPLHSEVFRNAGGVDGELIF